VPGQLCVAGICTHPCTGQFNQCPIGFNCTITDPASGLTCNKVSFAVDPTTGTPLLFGKSCATDATACDPSVDPAVGNPTCRKAEDPFATGNKPLANDPNAYCTGSCNSDSDCPFFMYCDVDYDGVQKCLERGQCSPCQYNDNCNADGTNKYACIPATSPNNMGAPNYCTPICNTSTDCPGAEQAGSALTANYLVCMGGVDSTGNSGNFCTHRYGACVGKGNVCDPCLKTSDCAASSTKCIENPFTLERMCTKQCTADSQCTSPESLPPAMSCDDTNLPSTTNPTGNSTGLCTGDSTAHQNPGVFSCWI
jgi:hypothetical protein